MHKFVFSEIIQAVESDSAESDFSGSSSDFVPDKSDEEVGKLHTICYRHLILPNLISF